MKLWEPWEGFWQRVIAAAIGQGLIYVPLLAAGVLRVHAPRWMP